MADTRNYISVTSDTEGLSARHIAANEYAYYEAARTGFFTFIVHGLEDIAKATYTGEFDKAQPDDKVNPNIQKYLQLNVVKALVPQFKLNILEYKRGNEKIKFAGTPEFHDGSIEVDDIVGVDTKSLLMAWQALAYNVHTARGGRMKNYKKNCTLIEYTQDYQEIRRWNLYGCWISDITDTDFDKTADGARKLTAKIEFDRAIPVEPATPLEW